MNLIRKLFQTKKERTIIIDTSALSSQKIMKVIESATKVILLCVVLEEMDKYKTEDNLFGFNIREVSRKSREDKKSKKYICVAGYDRHDYNDKNIIDYCRIHRKTIIVTSDNNLCNFAKAYGISYMFLEEKKKQVSKNNSKKSNKKPKIIRQKVKRVSYENEKLYFKIKGRNGRYFAFRDGQMLKTDADGIIELQLEDLIYMIERNEEGIVLTEYEIQVISENNYAFLKRKEVIESSENSKIEDIPTEVFEQICNILNPKEEPKEPILKGNHEVQLCKNWIHVTRNKGYYTVVKLEREGKQIRIQDYQIGDYLYILRYNLNKKYIDITVYEIILENNECTVKNVEDQRVYYVNQIYKLNFSEELKDEIWKILISKSGY